jgi:hypothetical protein
MEASSSSNALSSNPEKQAPDHIDATGQPGSAAENQLSREFVKDAMVQEITSLAKRILFSDTGRRASARVLLRLRSRPMPVSPTPPPLLKECLDLFDNFARCQSLTVEPSGGLPEYAEFVTRGTSSTIKLRYIVSSCNPILTDSQDFNIALYADHVYMTEKSYDNQMLRHRHILFLAVVIVHTMQHIFLQAALSSNRPTGLDRTERQKLHDSAHKIGIGRGPSRMSIRSPAKGNGVSLPLKVENGGWLFEEMLLGGQLSRIAARRDE